MQMFQSPVADLGEGPGGRASKSNPPPPSLAQGLVLPLLAHSPTLPPTHSPTHSLAHSLTHLLPQGAQTLCQVENIT